MGFLGLLGHWAAGNSYALIFLAMLIEGPVVTAIAAFTAALGYINPYAVLILSILGNLIPDVIYYAMGYWGREGFVDKYGHYLGMNPKNIARLEKLIHEHSGKSLVVIKLVPFLATPGLILTGVTRMDIKKYILWSLSITIPVSALYFLIGYYFGDAYRTIVHYLNIGGYVIAGLIVIFVIIFYYQRRFTEKLVAKIEEK